MVLDAHLPHYFVVDYLLVVVAHLQQLDASLDDGERIVVVQDLLPVLVEVIDFVQDGLQLAQVLLVLTWNSVFILQQHLLLV